MRRTPMSRGKGFTQRAAAPVLDEGDVLADPVVNNSLTTGSGEPATTTLKPLRRGTYASSTPVITVPKVVPVVSETYRRLVAARPCKLCGIAGFSQAAHPNTGKGQGTKTDDRLCFPLCCDRPGVVGCHGLFDQHALLSKEARRAIEPAWGADTRRAILAAGDWPAQLPLLNSR